MDETALVPKIDEATAGIGLDIKSDAVWAVTCRACGPACRTPGAR